MIITTKYPKVEALRIDKSLLKKKQVEHAFINSKVHSVIEKYGITGNISISDFKPGFYIGLHPGEELSEMYFICKQNYKPKSTIKLLDYLKLKNNKYFKIDDNIYFKAFPINESDKEIKENKIALYKDEFDSYSSILFCSFRKDYNILDTIEDSVSIDTDIVFINYNDVIQNNLCYLDFIMLPIIASNCLLCGKPITKIYKDHVKFNKCYNIKLDYQKLYDNSINRPSKILSDTNTFVHKSCADKYFK